MYLGRIGIFTNGGLKAIAECERALALNRNLAAAHATVGLAKIYIGRGEETEGHVREALCLRPRDTLAFSWMANAGLAKLYLCRDEEAIAWFRRAIDIDRNLPNAYFYLAAALAHLGCHDAARAAVRPGSRTTQPTHDQGFPSQLVQRQSDVSRSARARVRWHA
jgi:tetratricopeptide (TPR) repeat protein